MKASARVQPFRCRLVSPLETAAGRIYERSGWIVGLQDEAGAWGFGEAAPLPGHPAFRAESVEVSQRVLVRAAESLEELEESALAGWQPPEDAPAARFAIETAVADLAARREGRSLASWLAGAPIPHRVPVNALLGGANEAELGREALAARRRGFRTVKLKVGAGPPEADRARVAAVRERLGPEIAIRLDANGGWDVRTTRLRLAEFEPFGIEYVEDPMAVRSPDDVEALAELRRDSPVQIAVDECLADRFCQEAVLSHAAADVLVLKAAPLGGLAAALDLARRAAAEGLGVVVTSNLDATIGLTSSLHLAAALQSLLPRGRPRACGLATAAWLVDDVGVPPSIESGHMTVPDSPGLGVTPSHLGSFA